MLERCRETIVVAMIAVLLGFAVYTALGLALTFKIAVEAPQKFKSALRGSTFASRH
jgi:hypothetical protein